MIPLRSSQNERDREIRSGPSEGIGDCPNGPYRRVVPPDARDRCLTIVDPKVRSDLRGSLRAGRTLGVSSRLVCL